MATRTDKAGMPKDSKLSSFSKGSKFEKRVRGQNLLLPIYEKALSRKILNACRRIIYDDSLQLP